MVKYRSIPKIVDAEQFFVDKKPVSKKDCPGCQWKSEGNCSVCTSFEQTYEVIE